MDKTYLSNLTEKDQVIFTICCEDSPKDYLGVVVSNDLHSLIVATKTGYFLVNKNTGYGINYLSLANGTYSLGFIKDNPDECDLDIVTREYLASMILEYDLNHLDLDSLESMYEIIKNYNHKCQGDIRADRIYFQDDYVVHEIN